MKSAFMALVLLAWSVGGVGAFQLPTAGTTNGLGVNIAWDDYQSPNIDGILSAGTKAVRVFMDWSNVENYTQGVYDFNHFDQVLNAYAAYGVPVLFSMTGGNSFYGTDFTSQTWQTGFTNFAAATASHYKGDNCTLELWNEPDQPNVMSADTYMAIVHQAVPAMRLADPNCTIMGPNVGLTNASQWSPGPSYMTTCIQDGLLDLVDAFSVHPYRSGLAPETVVGDYATVHSLMQTYGVVKKTLPIVSSEWGYSTGQGWATVATAQLQGDYLARSFLVNMSQGIPLSLWYEWRNEGSDPTNYQDNFGMVDANLVPKPAYNEMKLLTSSLKGETFATKLNDRHTSDWLLVFASPSGQQTLAAWTTGSPRTVTVSGWGTLHLTSTPFYVNPTLLPGDANLDGTVDILDLAILAANYRKQVTGGWLQGDFNNDGVVDVNDLALLAANYRHSYASDVVPAFDGLDAQAIELLSLAGVTAVPEPGTLMLLGTALIGLLGYAWRKRR